MRYYALIDRVMAEAVIREMMSQTNVSDKRLA